MARADEGFRQHARYGLDAADTGEKAFAEDLDFQVKRFALMESRVSRWPMYWYPPQDWRASVLECGALRRFWNRTTDHLRKISNRSTLFRPQKRRGAAHSKTFGVRTVHGEAVTFGHVLRHEPRN